MALKHAQPLDVIDLQAFGGPADAPASSSLIKTDRLQLMVLLLSAGQQLPRHHVPGEITIQCLAGEADVATPQATCRLAAGSLVVLPAGESHCVHAHAPTRLLVTVLRAA